MPSGLDTPVLQVDTGVIHKVDTTNAQNLFSIWTVFARCGDSVAQGRRLENLSWRYWGRETLCVENTDLSATPTGTHLSSLPCDIQRQSRRPSSDELPQLSGSVESAVDEDAVEFSSESSALEIARPRIRRQDSCASSRSRGKERHITSDHLEKMVVDIVQDKETALAPLPELVSSYLPEEKPVEPLPQLERSGSSTTASPCKTSEVDSLEFSQAASSIESTSQNGTTTVVRGFSPVQTPTSLPMAASSRSSASDTIPEPQASPAPQTIQSQKQPATFTLGASSSLSDHAESPEVRRLTLHPKRNNVFQIGGSSGSGSDSLKSALHSPRLGAVLKSERKTASFSNQLETRIPSTSAIADDDEQSETEGESIDESAIDDDDDSSDWEDSMEDSGRSSLDDKTYFKRVDSKANLTSRPSLLTLMLEQNDRHQRLGNVTSQSTSAIHRNRGYQPPSLVASPNDSDESPLVMRRAPRAGPLRPINEVPRSIAQPIAASTTTPPIQVALTPRTTRRNMLSTELTESLRRHLLHERRQKGSTANAALRRRHTSHDVANLRQYPERAHMGETDPTDDSQYAFLGNDTQIW